MCFLSFIYLIGPAKQAQVVIIRGLFYKWVVPFFVDFDRKIDVSEFIDIVREAAKLEFEVVVATSDQGGSNRGLGNKLGVTLDKPYVNIQVSEEKSQKVFYVHDFVHIFKES